MVAVFHPNEIRVFDRTGAPVGVIPKWSVEQPRSFRLNEIEDFTFSIPRNDETGATVLTTTIVNLLRRDNLVYLANEMLGMRGWMGSITSATFGDGLAVVRCTGALGLFHKLDTELIEQSGGYVWTIAQRLVAAAQAKQAAHGDLVINFQHDETAGLWRRNFGGYSYEGDILAGLQSLGSETISEFFVHSYIKPDGNLTATLRWGGRYVIDMTDIVIKDGEGGTLQPGNQITFTSLGLVNRARLRGTPTNMGRFVDYPSVRAIIKDVTPECELTLDSVAEPHHRRREELGLTVGFGYGEETEKALALQVQEKYIGYYKSFLYAYHARIGKPFLEGYDWTGPDGTNDKQITNHYFRNYTRFAYIGQRTVITGSTTDDDQTAIEARVDDWQFRQTITPVSVCVGVAIDYADPGERYIADSASGQVYVLQADLATVSVWLNVAGAGETLKSVSTDSTYATLLWVLVTTASSAIVRAYNQSTKALVSEWSIPVPTANDITVDARNGVIWLVAADGVGNVQARDMNSGVLLTTGDYVSFASGFANPVGLSLSGGIAYVIDAAGSVRFLFTEDGAFAGTLGTGVGANGLFVDVSAGEIWIVRGDGAINIYRAHVAVATINAPGSVEGAPGFEAISAGQFVHIVKTADTAASPHPRNKYMIVYSPGHYETTTIPTTPGQPDAIQRAWVTGDQVVAIVPSSTVVKAELEQVVQGEESRVDDWDPKRDGYGLYYQAVLRTARGHVIYYPKGWFRKDWDIPDSEFEVDPPEWTEGLAYLQAYLARVNTEKTIQVLKVTNRGDLFKKIVLGGKYTVQVTRQGPPAGFSGTLRVLAFTPDEREGSGEIIGEWV